MPSRRVTSHQRRRSRAVRPAALAVTTLLLSGCSMDWASMSPALPAPASPASASPASASSAPPAEVALAAGTSSPTTSLTGAAPRMDGDLDTGAATRVLPAGQASLVVDYWTAQDPATWTAATEGVVQLSAHLEDTDDEVTVLVSRFTATATAPDGTRSVLADDRGEFVITPPFSYGTALTVPASAPAESASESAGPGAVEVALQWDLLVETEAESGRFFRQTVVDQLTIALAAEPSVSRPAASGPEPTAQPAAAPTARRTTDTDGAPR